LETAIWLNWKSLAVVQRTGVAPKRAGPNAEWPVLPCADGYVVVVHRMQEWQRLMTLVDDPALRAERFQTPMGRRKHRTELNAILARYFAGLTRSEIHDISLRHKLPFGAVWEPRELLRDPQMVARDMFHSVASQNGDLPQPRLPALWHGDVA
jgi:crotonobetainyl-CoA:carnitine CoA-transferase CaiB-like acyl-CoA transferase